MVFLFTELSKMPKALRKDSLKTAPSRAPDEYSMPSMSGDLVNAWTITVDEDSALAQAVSEQKPNAEFIHVAPESGRISKLISDKRSPDLTFNPHS